MPFTTFVPGSEVTAEWCNRVSRPKIVSQPDNDGELAPIDDDQLSQGSSSLLARANLFLGAFLTTASSGLAVTVGGGTVVLADGTPVENSTTEVTTPPNTTHFIWLDPTGAIASGSTTPSDGSVLVARVTTDTSSVTAVADLRPRFKIGSVDYTPPAVVGQIQGFSFPVEDFEWTDEIGWVWLNVASSVYISRASGDGDVKHDGYERLFKRLWPATNMTIFDSDRNLVAKNTPNADWDAGRLLKIEGLSDRVPMAAGNTYAVGARGGRDEVALTVDNNARHNHGVTDPGHDHSHTDTGVEVNQEGQGDGPIGDLDRNVQTKTTGSSYTNISIQNSGSGTPFSIVPKYWAETKLIFTGIKVS